MNPERSQPLPRFSQPMVIADKPGALAAIATLLAQSGISIKNIGIVHNREFQEGVLHIEFYDEESAEKATELLAKYHYVIHLRK